MLAHCLPWTPTMLAVVVQVQGDAAPLEQPTHRENAFMSQPNRATAAPANSLPAGVFQFGPTQRGAAAGLPAFRLGSHKLYSRVFAISLVSGTPPPCRCALCGAAAHHFRPACHLLCVHLPLPGIHV